MDEKEKEELVDAIENNDFKRIQIFLRNYYNLFYHIDTSDIIIQYMLDMDYIKEILQEDIVYGGYGFYYTYDELKKLPLKILKPIAAYYGINVHKNMRKRELIREIIIANFFKIIYESQITEE